jgi:hypothetical protein
MDHDGKRFVVHAPRPVPPPVSPIRTPLREIELRRDHMGLRLRAASDEILDAQVKVPRIAAESGV